MIGRRLTELLLARGHNVRHLARSGDHSVVDTYLWNVGEKKFDRDALKDTDAIIHLAGENIGAKRWTQKRKREILESRVQSTRLLGDALVNYPNNVTTYIGASAIGYYGDTGATLVTEKSPSGKGFLAEVARQWENEHSSIATPSRRVVIVRTGIVLSEREGALEPMERQTRLGIGSPLGDGDQFMSWVHLDDHCKAIIHLLEHAELAGTFNSVAPHPVTNAQFMKTLASVLHRPYFMPRVPSWLLNLLLGEMAALVLEGCNASSDKLKSTGYEFSHTRLENALKELLINPTP